MPTAPCHMASFWFTAHEGSGKSKNLLKRRRSLFHIFLPLISPYLFILWLSRQPRTRMNDCYLNGSTNNQLLLIPCTNWSTDLLSYPLLKLWDELFDLSKHFSFRSVTIHLPRTTTQLIVCMHSFTINRREQFVKNLHLNSNHMQGKTDFDKTNSHAW